MTSTNLRFASPPSRGLSLVGLALAAALAVGPEPVSAQTCPLAPGCTRTVQESVPFARTALSLWGADGPSVGDFSNLEQFTLEWDVTDSDSDIATVGTVLGDTKWGGSVEGAASGKLGMFMTIYGYQDGDFDISYPVDVAVTVPEANTFRAGEAVTIRTSWAPGDANLRVRHRPFKFKQRATFSMGASAGFKVCVASCGDLVPFFPTIDVPETDFTVWTMEDEVWGYGDDTSLPFLPDEAVLVQKALTGQGLWMNVARPFGNEGMSGTKVYARGSAEVYREETDYDKRLQYAGILPSLPPLGASLPLDDYAGFSAFYETIDLDLEATLTEREDLTFDVAGIQVKVDLGREMAFDVQDPGGNVTRSGLASSVSLPVGHDLVLYFPDDVTPVELAPTFSLVGGEVGRSSKVDYRFTAEGEALSLGLSMSEQDFSRDRREDQGGWERDCPSFDSDPWGYGECWALAFVDLPRKWLEWVSDWVTKTYNYVANAAQADLGPVWEQRLYDRTQAWTILEDTWPVDGFDAVAGAPWTLDPEDPRIAVSTSAANALFTTGQNPGQVIQTITVSNQGDVPISLVDLLDALSAEGLTVQALTSSDVTVNGGFDGLGDPETLAEGSLDVGASATLQARVTAEPGRMYTADVSTLGRSPIGTDVRAAAPLSFAVFDMAMSPYKVEYKSGREKGKLKARICSSPWLDAAGIDGGSLRLEGVAPGKVKLKRHDDDDDEDKAGCGGAYLEATFNRGHVIEALLARTAAQAAQAAQVAALAVPTVPTPPIADIAQHVLTGAGLTSDEASALDRAGNRNGRLDLGDLRALALGDGGVAVGAGTTAASGKPSKHDEHGKDEKAPTHTLVLSGTVSGTPLWAEAPIHLKLKEDD